ncbi:MAG: class II aldolase/adducin family protein [Halioglobus sp.]|nr:class II aldolase/adducin family protein [Halioglobus sp.]
MQEIAGINADVIKMFAPNPGRTPLLPDLSPQAQVALMCRMLFREGWNEHIAGHSTYRLEDGRVLANPWELAWDEVCASDIVTLDENGKVLEGEWNITPAVGLHLQLHKLRPDVNVVIHNHAQWSGIWANMHRVPPVYDQAGAYVDGPLPLYNEYAGTFEDKDKTLAAVQALGDAKWALLANHGSLVVGKDLRQAHLRVATLEWRSKRAYELEMVGGGVPLTQAQIAEIALPDANGFPFLWEAMARRELRADPSVLD